MTRSVFKIIIIILFCTCLCMCLPFYAAADETDDNIMKEQYYASGADKIYDALPKESRRFLNDIGADNQIDLQSQLSPKSFFESLISLVSVNAKTVVLSVISCLGIILASSVITGISSGNETALSGSLSLTVALAAALCIAIPVSETLVGVVSVIETAAKFLTVFVPVFAAVLTASGKSLAAAGFSGTFLFALEAVAGLCGTVFTPLVTSHLALTVCSAAGGEMGIKKAAALIKRIAGWTLTLLSTVFVFILGIQSSSQAAADTVSMKTAKFIVGSSVPVVGSALSEAMTAVKGCVNSLGAGIGGYAALAVAAIFLPSVIKLFLWRAALLSLSAVASMLSNDRLSEFAESVDMSVGLAIAIILNVLVAFVFAVFIGVRIGAAV